MSIPRASNASNSVTAPRSPMGGVAPSTSIMESRRRAAAMASFSCVNLLSKPQYVQLRLEGAPIDYLGRFKFICHKVFHRSFR
jgi:hypothetical protein